MRSTHVFDEHVQQLLQCCGSNSWHGAAPLKLLASTDRWYDRLYFSSIAGSQGCAAARTAQIACCTVNPNGLARGAADPHPSLEASREL